jgi:hypothetical protein
MTVISIKGKGGFPMFGSLDLDFGSFLVQATPLPSTTVRLEYNTVIHLTSCSSDC